MQQTQLPPAKPQFSYEELKRTALRRILPYYCEHVLKIKTKEGGLVPLKLNRAQLMAHEFAEQMLREVGYVRINVLKARKEGISTYIGARFFHKATHLKARTTAILSHQISTTEELFQMVQTFHTHLPEEIKPNTGFFNTKELSFTEQGSDYNVGTAGSTSWGRGFTIHFLHNSEMAFWKNADLTATGAIQAVADAKGTEIWNETTANGAEYFKKLWYRTERGETEYRNLFLPWFILEEYTRPPTPGFEPTDEEWKLIEKYGLSYSQIAWRRFKISSMGSIEKFQQEYPATPEEAFEGGNRKGKVFNTPQDEYTVAPFEIPDHWPQGYGLDFGWHPDPTAAVRLAYDKSADIAYAIAEYGATELTPQSHAANLDKMGMMQLPGVSDPFGGKHRGPDGSQVLQAYINAGLNLHEADRMGVLASVLEWVQRVETGRFKVFSTCARLRQEMRMYHYDEKTGQPADKENHFLDATRYPLICGLQRFVTISQLKNRLKAVRKNRDWRSV